MGTLVASQVRDSQRSKLDVRRHDVGHRSGGDSLYEHSFEVFVDSGLRGADRLPGVSTDVLSPLEHHLDLGPFSDVFPRFSAQRVLMEVRGVEYGS